MSEKILKLVSFSHTGQESYGVVTFNGVVDLGRMFGADAPDLKTFLSKDLLGRVRAAADADAIAFDQLTLLPVIPNPGKIVCVGLNYHEHVEETGRAVMAHPTLFLRVPESQTAHDADLLLPPETQQLDFEGEIAVIVGRAGRRIAAASAFDHIAGYACYNDGSLRDWQAASNQWTAGKNFSRTGAFGPWMVTADEIGPGEEMTLVTRVNGREMQRASTRLMIHSIPALIEHISTLTTLEPGDVIVTGTPGGIGAKRKPPVFLADGDVVEIEVDRIGVLRNRIAREAGLPLNEKT